MIPKRGVVRFGKQGELSLRYIRSFEILEKGGCSCIPNGFAAKVINCQISIPCFHAPEVHPTSDSSVGLRQAYR